MGKEYISWNFCKENGAYEIIIHQMTPKGHFPSVEAQKQNTVASDQSVLFGIDFSYYKQLSPYLILCIK